MFEKLTRPAPIVALVVLAFAFTGASADRSLGRCITAKIPAEVVLPDGTTHAASALRICHTRDLSPVMGLHETTIGGQKVGAFMSVKGESEGLPPDAQPYFLFVRRGDGALVLQAYAVPDRDRFHTYSIEPTREYRERLGRLLADVQANPDGKDAPRVVLVTAAAE